MLPRIPNAKRKRSSQDNNRAREEGWSGAMDSYTQTHIQMGEHGLVMLKEVKSETRGVRQMCFVS